MKLVLKNTTKIDKTQVFKYLKKNSIIQHWGFEI